MTARFLALLVICGIVAALPWIVRDAMKDNGVDKLAEWSGKGLPLIQGGAPETEMLAAVKTPKPVPDSSRSREVLARVRPSLAMTLQEKGLTFGSPIFIRLFKESSELELWVQKTGSDTFVLFRTYKICRWSGTLGPKEKEGDGQAPEGFYFVGAGRMNPQSRYHLAFDLGYPNALDQSLRRTGSLIMVHGGCLSIGCFAMTDEGIEEIYVLAEAALKAGQPFFRVHCFPFRMTDERMDEVETKKEKWLDFWTELKPGYDFFEILGRPPVVEAKGGHYRILDTTPSPE